MPTVWHGATAHKKLIMAITAAAALAVAYYFFDPSQTAAFPKCPFFVATGLKCPGCGSQRALHSLLHLDIIGAAKYNALLVVAIPFVAALAAAQRFRTSFPRVYNHLNSQAAIWTTLGVIVIWTVARNIAEW